MLKKILPLFLAVCVLAGTAMVAAGATADPNDPAKLTQEVKKVLRTTNKAQINRYIPKVYDFKNVNPYAIITFLTLSAEIEEGIVDTYVAPDGNSGKALLVLPDYMFEYVDPLMAQLDRPGLTTSSGTKWAYLELNNRSAGDSDVPLSLLQYGSADTLIVADMPVNAVLVTGAPSGVDAVLGNAGVYDIPTGEVSIAAKVYEVETTNDGTIGADWVAWKNGPGRALFSVGAFGEYNKVSSVQGVNGGQQFSPGGSVLGIPGRTMKNHGRNASYYYDVPSAFFDFLNVKGSAKVLTEGSVTVLNQQPAMFRSIEQILYFEVDPAAPSVAEEVDADVDSEDELILPVAGQDLLDRGSFAINDRRLEGASVERASELIESEAGFELEVIPTISLENIDMEIFSSVATVLGFDDAGVPMIGSRIVETRLRAQSSEEVVIGGLTRDREIRTVNKAPFIGSIPVLGYLFGNEVTTKKVTEVVEVIQPTCLEGCGGLTLAQEQAIKKARKQVNVDTGSDVYGFEQYILDPPSIVIRDTDYIQK